MLLKPGVPGDPEGLLHHHKEETDPQVQEEIHY